jgi:hypothetical protein
VHWVLLLAVTFWGVYVMRREQLNSTQLNSTQLNSTQLNSTQQLGTTTRMHRSHEIFGIVFNTKLHSVFAVCIRSSSLHAKFQHHTKHAFSFFLQFSTNEAITLDTLSQAEEITSFMLFLLLYKIYWQLLWRQSEAFAIIYYIFNNNTNDARFGCCCILDMRVIVWE